MDPTSEIYRFEEGPPRRGTRHWSAGAGILLGRTVQHLEEMGRQNELDARLAELKASRPCYRWRHPTQTLNPVAPIGAPCKVTWTAPLPVQGRFLCQGRTP